LVWTNYRDRDGNLVVELPNAVAGPAVADLAPGAGLVAAIEVEELRDGDRPLVRLVVETRGESEHSLASEGDVLVLELLPVGYEPPAAVAVEPVVEEPVGRPAVARAEPPPAGTPDAPHLGPPPTGVEASRLVAVDAQATSGRTVVRVTGDGEFAYATFRLQNPERFVLDLTGVVNTSARATIAASRSSRFASASSNPVPTPSPGSSSTFAASRCRPSSAPRTASPSPSAGCRESGSPRPRPSPSG
jgi:hypothetical protein